jgi:hypothetical protein
MPPPGGGTRPCAAQNRVRCAVVTEPFAEQALHDKRRVFAQPIGIEEQTDEPVLLTEGR